MWCDKHPLRLTSDTVTWYLTPTGPTVGAWYGQTNLLGDNVRDLNIIMRSLYYCELSVTNPDWQLLGSGEDRTMLPGWALGWLAWSPVPAHIRRGWAESPRAGQRRQTHFITSNIITNARYAQDVSCRIQFIWKSLLHNGVYSAWLCSCHPCFYPQDNKPNRLYLI